MANTGEYDVHTHNFIWDLDFRSGIPEDRASPVGFFDIKYVESYCFPIVPFYPDKDITCFAKYSTAVSTKQALPELHLLFLSRTTEKENNWIDLIIGRDSKIAIPGRNSVF